jgi:Swiss Army Knife protein, DSP-PTPase phosphatase domain
MRLPPDFADRLFVLLEAPAPLAGMAFPDPEPDWSHLYRLGFRRVVRLHPGDYDPSPLVADEIILEDLKSVREPRDPSLEHDRVVLAGRLVADSLQRGEGAVVHCLGGIGRTGTVLGCALRQLGYTADEAVAAIKAHRPRWPESPWQEEVVRGSCV